MLAAGAMVAFSPVVINEIEDAPILGEGEATNSTNDLTLAVSAADGSGEQIQRSLTLEGEVTPGVSAIAADLGEEDLTDEVLAKVLSARLALQRSVSLVVNDTAPNSPVVLDTEVSDAPRIDVATVPGGESNMPLVVVASQADVSHSGSEDEGASDEEGDALAPLTSDGAAVYVDTAAELDLTGDTTGADADATA